MSSIPFNKQSAPSYTSHAHVLLALSEIAVQSAGALGGASQPQSPAEAKTLAETGIKTMTAVSAKLDRIRAGVENSPALAEGVREGFMQVLDAQDDVLAISLALLKSTAAFMDDTENYELMQQVLDGQQGMQKTQMALHGKTVALLGAIYGFAPGQTMLDVMPAGAPTIEDIERVKAMFDYSATLPAVMEKINAAGMADDEKTVMALFEDATKVVRENLTALIDLSTAVDGSAAMTLSQKTACNKLLSSTQMIFADLETAIESILDGDLSVAAQLPFTLLGRMNDFAAASQSYAIVLVDHYDAKAAGSASKPSGPQRKNG